MKSRSTQSIVFNPFIYYNYFYSIITFFSNNNNIKKPFVDAKKTKA